MSEADDQAGPSRDSAERPFEAYLPPTAEPVRAERKHAEDLALLRRPVFSIRARIILALSVIFALCVAITVWNIYMLSLLRDKLHFLEVADSYMSEIQEARRFEKNYLLYGTNLEDAWQHLRKAQTILRRNRRTISALIGAENMRTVVTHVSDYGRLLRELGDASSSEAASGIERRLRDHGSQMISFAKALSREERDSVDRTFQLVRLVPFGFLAVLLVLMLVVASFLARQLLSSLSRFTAYAERIGQGDFSPIMPARKYRDEFSQLALAFNHMIDELDRRHEILVESHKLRAIGNLVAGVAHELNNPLNNIFLTASSLLEDYDDLGDEEKIDMGQDVMKEAERARHIVRNLLDFARQTETRIEPIHLDEVLQKSMGLVANQLKLAKITLDLSVPPGLPPIHGDSQMLTQVFVNLILNALDVLPKGGRIEVTARGNVEPGYVAVLVSDNGPGIPEDVLPSIFKPFFTTKTKGKGTGLGLSVSSGIVAKHGGTIRVTTGPTTGTTFTVLLPETEIPFERPSSS